jgi:hypothetical protein
LVSPFVGVVLEKLIDQMAVGGHKLDAVEARLFRTVGGGTILLEDAGNLRRFQRPVRRCLSEAVRSIDDNVRISPISRIDRSRDRLRSRNRDVRRAAACQSWVNM